MSPNTNLPLESLLGDDGFAEFCETDAFAAFERELEISLAELEDRYAGWVNPNARNSHRHAIFPTPFPKKAK